MQNTIHEPEFTDEEEVDLTEKPSSISEISKYTQKTIFRRNLKMKNILCICFKTDLWKKLINDPKIAEEILKELKDYMDNRLPENLNLLLSKLTKKYGLTCKDGRSFFWRFLLA